MFLILVKCYFYCRNLGISLTKMRPVTQAKIPVWSLLWKDEHFQWMSSTFRGLFLFNTRKWWLEELVSLIPSYFTKSWVEGIIIWTIGILLNNCLVWLWDQHIKDVNLNLFFFSIECVFLLFCEQQARTSVEEGFGNLPPSPSAPASWSRLQTSATGTRWNLHAFPPLES